MSDPFATMIDNLFVSKIAVYIDYESNNGGGWVGNIPSLQRSLDTEGELGAGVRVAHNIRQLEIRVKDLESMVISPERGDVVRPAGIHDGDAWKVQSRPNKDLMGLVWIMDVYKV